MDGDGVHQDGIAAAVLPGAEVFTLGAEAFNAEDLPPADGHLVPIANLKELPVDLGGFGDDMQQVDSAGGDGL